MEQQHTIGVAIIGSGNIGTDLMIKIIRKYPNLALLAFVGIDPASDGIQRAQKLGIHTISNGIEGLLADDCIADIKFVFDATSAKAHVHHHQALSALGIKLIDLTPAAIGPFTVPALDTALDYQLSNFNMVTCGGQATIPMVAAVNSVSDVAYAEIIASISSKSAGPGTRANIDEFTETTSKAIQEVGGAARGKAIIILNPAEPPIIMRDTVYCLVAAEAKQDDIVAAVAAMVTKVQSYVPGYRLKQAVQFDVFTGKLDFEPAAAADTPRLKVSVYLEVEGAGHYLPSYAGNLDIMTSAALATCVKLIEKEAEALHV